MKILYIISGLKYGGAEKLLFLICKQMLHTKPVKIDIISLDCSVPLASLFEELGIRVRIYSKSPFTIIKLSALIIKNRYEIVHSHLIHADMIGRAAACISRTFYKQAIYSTTHDNYWFRWKKTIYSRIVQFFDRKFANLDNSWVFTISETIEESLINFEHIPKAKLIRLNNAIEIPLRHCQRPIRTDGYFNFIFIGRFIPEKNIFCLIEAVRSCLDLPFSLLLVGDGPLKTCIQDKISEYDLQSKIKLMDPILKTEQLYNSHDLLILPSLLEGLPMVILEAFSYGLPVIGSNIAGIKELLADDRGLLFTSNDPKSLKEAIRKAVTSYDSLLASARNAYQYVNKNHNIINYVDFLYGHYLHSSINKNKGKRPCNNRN